MLISAQLQHDARKGDVRAQVELGLALEASGRSFEAMDWLALAARGGDVEALTLVGLRLTAGRHGPQLRGPGVRLLEEAALAGGAEAARRLAVVHAMGLDGRQDWSRALDRLRRAAELGSPEARTELAILSHEPAGDVGSSSRHWAELRESVDISSWTRPAHAQVLCRAPLIRAFRSAASRAACAWIIEQARPRLARAEVYDPATGRTRTTAARNNQAASFTLETTNLVVLALQQLIARSVSANLVMSEGASALFYAPGEQAAEHFDFLDPAEPAYAADIARAGQRIATGLIYLNDDYAGGETEFPELDIRHRGRTGSGLVFLNVNPLEQPDPRSLHAGRPPQRHGKWVLSCFVRNRTTIGRLGTQ